jgi:hypothetical protein
MSAEVVQLVSPQTVERAWSDFVEYARDLVDDPRLITDRRFYAEYTRRHEKWKKLFMAMEERSS